MNDVSSAFVDALEWHHNAERTGSAAARSYQHVQAIINEYTGLLEKRDARIEQLERKYAEACALRMSTNETAVDDGIREALNTVWIHLHRLDPVLTHEL